MKEILCDGPLDGLEVEVKGNVYSPCQGLDYIRYADGRLYLKGSRWDKTGGQS